jgi:hypothetical protein
MSTVKVTDKITIPLESLTMKTWVLLLKSSFYLQHLARYGLFLKIWQWRIFTYDAQQTFDGTKRFADPQNLCTLCGIMFLYAFNQKLLTKTYSYVMAAMFKVNGQGHRPNNHTIRILDHENMGIAFGIVFLSAIVCMLRPIL